MMMAALSTKPSVLIRQLLSQKQATKPDQTFIPFSQLQQIKLLENRLVNLLHDCDDLNRIKQVHGYIVRKGLDDSCFVLTKLVRALTEVGTPIDSYARLVFQQVKQPNPFLWTALIRGYSIQGMFRKSILTYIDMRRNDMGPVSFTFTAIFKVCSSVPDPELGKQFHVQTITMGGFSSDLFVGNSMIDMYVKCDLLDYARQVFDNMPQRDVISWTSLIVAYAKKADMESAVGMFERLPIKDMISWTSIITGFAQNSLPKEALHFFQKMQDAGIETDEVTLVGVISACAQLGTYKYAKRARDVTEKSGFGPPYSVVIGSALIDMFSKCGCIDDAWKVFDKMKVRNVYSYSSMIHGFAMHGCADSAMRLFDEMIEKGTQPNGVTFIGLLSACSHAGLVDKGRNLFAEMKERFDIEPWSDHYVCMVDLLGRAGFLDEAVNLIETMPIEPTGGVWGALLGACRIHKNPNVAEIAAANLFELEPSSIGNYVLLSSIYASARMWDEVSRVRVLMRNKGLKKNPGFSRFEGENGDVYEFVAGDTTHPKYIEIKRAVDDLLNRLFAHGYEVNLSCVSYDLNDVEKKKILSGHSEKLALAYGLVSTRKGSTIRIVKNLRICEDCHSVMCFTSRTEGREIVVRDNLRFHRFSGGICSCGGFW
ncbi:pentatricopeptide repeat-containing protein At5g44230-like [Impatiens glandulifera]|uniref:pentatricopeptide repeat-containing protein At5g44230-like n=1 Tax=Impatiens glandulifera TaxID=253017 RepID=UPI001FB13E00|nr:pentatricopeptide repeat-containing protein At5g44230-like [Impatiens glandulifera]